MKPTVDSAEYWDERAADYASVREPSIPDRATLDAVPPRGRVLEVGCGPGVFTEQGVAAGGDEWLAADVSPTFCEMVRQRLPDVRVICADVRDLDLPAAYVDTLYAMAVLHHLPDEDIDPVLASLARLLVPGGRMALVEEWAFEPADEAERRVRRLRRNLALAGTPETHPDETRWRHALSGAGLEIEALHHPRRRDYLTRYDALTDPESLDDLAWLRQHEPSPTVPMSLFVCRQPAP